MPRRKPFFIDDGDENADWTKANPKVKAQDIAATNKALRDHLRAERAKQKKRGRKR